MLDGSSSSLAAAARKAEALERNGVQLTVVGPVASEVAALATSASSGLVVEDYCQLHSVDGVIDGLCQGNNCI